MNEDVHDGVDRVMDYYGVCSLSENESTKRFLSRNGSVWSLEDCICRVLEYDTCEDAASFVLEEYGSSGEIPSDAIVNGKIFDSVKVAELLVEWAEG